MNPTQTPPPEVRQFTIENAAYEICDQSMDIADRGGIPDHLWQETVEECTWLADRGLLVWLQPTDHGCEPWLPGARTTWEYGVERRWGTEWGASVGMSHRYEYTAESVHALADGNPVWRRQRTHIPDQVTEPEPYPNPTHAPTVTP